MNGDHIESLVQTVLLFSEDIGMQFGLSECGSIGTEEMELVKLNGIALLNGQMMKEIYKNECKYIPEYRGDE